MYPPLDVLKPIAKDLWVVDSGPLHYMGLSLPIRMTVIRLHSGAIWLHSPTRLSEALGEEINGLGPVSHIVAPNVAHWTMAKEWQDAFPGAITWAAPHLPERKQVQRSGLRFARDLGGTAPPDWSGELDQVVVPGGFGYSEVVFFHRPTATLLLTDLIVNLEPEGTPPFTVLLARLTGTLAPDGRAPVYLRQIVRMRRREAAAAIAQVLALDPERAIFSHGAWYRQDAAAQLRAAFSWLLPDGRV